jgi:hypothetical protein
MEREGYRAVTLSDFLTKQEINEAWQIYLSGPFDTAADRLTAFVDPRIGTINERLKQENVPRYIAYAMLYVFMKQGAQNR